MLAGEGFASRGPCALACGVLGADWALLADVMWPLSVLGIEELALGPLKPLGGHNTLVNSFQVRRDS